MSFHSLLYYFHIDKNCLNCIIHDIFRFFSQDIGYDMFIYILLYLYILTHVYPPFDAGQSLSKHFLTVTGKVK